jgi:hypothetical protein
MRQDFQHFLKKQVTNNKTDSKVRARILELIGMSVDLRLWIRATLAVVAKSVFSFRMMRVFRQLGTRLRTAR